MSQSSHRYQVDSADPRAPTQALWEQLSESERIEVMDALPSEIEKALPEGDPHRNAKNRALEALDAFFRETGRRIYLSSELPVYYPNEAMFAPDIIAVTDVESYERTKWVVSQEGKGLDLALEVLWGGSRKKDCVENVARFVRLGIHEYFIFDRRNMRLRGYRLASPEEPYVVLVPQGGRWHSEVLGLDLGLKGERLQFFAGTALVPDQRELLERANGLLDDLQTKIDRLEALLEHEKQRAEHEKQRAEHEKQRAEHEKQRADRAEMELRALREQLTRGEPGKR